jgi:hypothetical protein
MDDVTMITKLVDLVNSGYLTPEESAEIERLHLQHAPLTGEEIQWLKALYNRLYSVHR